MMASAGVMEKMLMRSFAIELAYITTAKVEYCAIPG